MNLSGGDAVLSAGGYQAIRLWLSGRLFIGMLLTLLSNGRPCVYFIRRYLFNNGPDEALFKTNPFQQLPFINTRPNRLFYAQPILRLKQVIDPHVTWLHRVWWLHFFFFSSHNLNTSRPTGLKWGCVNGSVCVGPVTTSQTAQPYRPAGIKYTTAWLMEVNAPEKKYH